MSITFPHFKRNTHSKKHHFSSWLLMIGGCAVAFLIILALSALYFVRISNDYFLTKAPEETVPIDIIKRNELEQVLSFFAKRAEKTKAIETSTVILPDPAK
ncbi:hypothetical protein IPF86_01290 [Candidatus Nomurabacteria bacterium]|nr:MAG: hypothetical protein IPF86_01290 [Candidatus Nomurabacteria bacterium]